MQHTLWYINLLSMHEHVVKFPYARSPGEPKHTTANFFSLFLHLSAVPKNSTQGKFAYICHFQRIGIINVTKFEKTRIHFVSDIFVAVAVTVVDAKAPYSHLRLLSKKDRYKRIFSSMVFRIRS